jgi:hypothetical protein
LIYFVQAISGGPIKIGFSDNVSARVRQLEAHYGQPLAILATMPGDREDEREIHGRFATARMGRTEQFRPVAEIMAFIGCSIIVDIDPYAVEVMEAADTSVKLDVDVVRIAKIVAAYRDVSLAEYLSNTLKPIVQGDLDREQTRNQPKRSKGAKE